MQVFWYIITPLVIIVAVITLVDVFRRHHGGWATAGWVVLVVVLPFVGSIIYWATRKSTPADAEAIYLAERDTRQRR